MTPMTRTPTEAGPNSAQVGELSRAVVATLQGAVDRLVSAVEGLRDDVRQLRKSIGALAAAVERHVDRLDGR
jgi:hypothetical protein